MPTDPRLGQRIREGMVTLLALFSSTGTLVCCALPITLVTLGLGSAVVSLVGAAPWLIPLSRHKAWIFGGTALMLILGSWLLYRPGRSCPSDPRMRNLCIRLDRWNRRLLGVAATLWAVGFAAAYLLLPLARVLGH